jgi:hypothetical protein
MKNWNMKLVTATLAFFALLFICHGQQTAPPNTNGLFQFDERPFRHVEFSISLGTNALAVNATNHLQCTISNSSTNIILYSKQTLTVYLTNTSGASCILFEHPKQDPRSFGATVPSIDFEPLEIGGATRWLVDVAVSNTIAAGSYRLVANEFIANEFVAKQRTALAWHLHSALNVEVIKAAKR